MERKIFTGQVPLIELAVGDSIVDLDMSQWNHITAVPQEVADIWASLFSDTYLSGKSKVGESPMKDWQKGLGIIVAIELDALQMGERLIMLKKAQGNGFGLLRSVGTRPIV